MMRHTHPTLTLPLGFEVCVDFNQQQVEVIEPLLP